MSTNNVINTGNPIEVANGGTGAASFTANTILYGNSTSAVQALAAGARGQILKSQGTTTPQFAASAQYEFLYTQTLSSATPVTFNSDIISSTYNIYVIQWTNFSPSSNGYCYVQVSTNNGNSYVSSGYTSQVLYYTYNGTTGTSNTLTSGFLMAPTDNLITTSPAGGTLWLIGLTASSNPMAIGKWFGVNTSGTSLIGFSSGTIAQSSINAIQIAPSSTNFGSISVSIYGLKES